MMMQSSPNQQIDNINITTKEKSGSIETNFFKYAIRFLQETTDIDKSINSLLSLLSNLFNVDQVAVFEVDNDECDILYQWAMPGVVPFSRKNSNKVLGYIRKHFVTNEYGRMFVCADVDELPVETATQLRKLQVTSGMCVRIADFSSYGRRYYLVCDCCQSTRPWSSSEKETVCMAASIIGVYMNLKASQNENEINKQRIQNIFDALDSFVYIVNVETKEVLYVNAAIRKLLGSKSIGGICYEEFCGSQAACESCLAGMADYNDVVTRNYYNQLLKMNVKVKARLIEWDKNCRTALLICEKADK